MKVPVRTAIILVLFLPDLYPLRSAADVGVI